MVCVETELLVKNWLTKQHWVKKMKTFIITTVSSIYTIKNCNDSNHAIEKMKNAFDGFSIYDVLNIEEQI